MFKEIFRVKIKEPTLRELLLIRSIYTNRVTGGVKEIVSA